MEYFSPCTGYAKLYNAKNENDSFTEVSTEQVETFGIEEQPCSTTEDSHKKWNVNNIEEESIEVVAKYVQSLLDNEDDEMPELTHSYILTESGKMRKRLHILHDSICLWRTQHYLQCKFGKKIVTHQSLIHDCRSVRMDLDDDDEEEISSFDTSAVQTLANAKGFNIIPIQGDGDCFFSAVAVQIRRLVLENKMSKYLTDHLHSIRINHETLVALDSEAITGMLRALIVEEWKGPFMEDYQKFFTSSIDIQREASEFLRSGHFSSSLGDAMPLAMANVLQVPIFILTPHYLTPFVSVFPRRLRQSSHVSL